jgi:hypothetical protein
MFEERAFIAGQLAKTNTRVRARRSAGMPVLQPVFECVIAGTGSHKRSKI